MRTFKEPGITKRKVIKGNNQQSNFELGINPMNYNTTYNRNMKDRPNDHKLDIKKLQGTNYSLGKQGNHYLTEFKQQYFLAMASPNLFSYGTKTAQKNELSKQRKRDLQASHFKFSDL